VTDIAAWLTAIWDEQEKDVAVAVLAAESAPPPAHDHRLTPRENLTRIAADRQILDFVRRANANAGDPPGMDRADANALWYVIRLLALPYADRPGYREEWKP
jgi:hypothetical protein